VEYGASSSENSDTTEDTSSEGSSEDTTESSATSESEVKSPVTENEGKPVGGEEIAVACQGTNEIIFYDGATLDIKLSPDLGTGVSPMAITFIRTPDEKGEAVTGTYAVWNANNTLSLIKNGSGLTVAGSPFVFSGTSPVITATGQNIKKGLVLTGYMDGTNSFIDVRDSNGSSFLSSPYGLLNDCQGTGPAGIHTEFMDLEPTQEEIDAGFPEFDIWIYYTCPNTGFIGGLSANLGITFLVRRVPGNVLPGPIQGKPEGGVLYVGLTGTDAPAPGVLVLNQNSLTDAILGVSFLQGSPTQLLVVP
jgi:hypothetical protein